MTRRRLVSGASAMEDLICKMRFQCSTTISISFSPTSWQVYGHGRGDRRSSADWRVRVIARWFGRPHPLSEVDLASSTFVEREDVRWIQWDGALAQAGFRTPAA